MTFAKPAVSAEVWDAADQMTIRVHYFDAGKLFGRSMATIRRTLVDAVAHVEDRSTLADVDVVVQPLDSGRDQFPIAAFTMGPHNIHIGIERSQLRGDDMEADLFRAAVHEMHHALRWRHRGPIWTVGEVVVLEGLALLADTAAAGPDDETDRPLTDPGAALQKLERIRAEPLSAHRHWLYSSEDSQPGGPERVYSLGRLVLGAALEAIDADPWQAATMRADDLLSCGAAALPGGGTPRRRSA